MGVLGKKEVSQTGRLTWLLGLSVGLQLVVGICTRSISLACLGPASDTVSILTFELRHQPGCTAHRLLLPASPTAHVQLRWAPHMSPAGRSAIALWQIPQPGRRSAAPQRSMLSPTLDPTPVAAKTSLPGRPGSQAQEPAWLAAPRMPAAAAGRLTSVRWPSPAGSWTLCGASTSSWSCRTAPRCLLGVSWTSSARGTRLPRLRSRRGSACWERLSWTCLHCRQVGFWRPCRCHASAAGEAAPVLEPAPVSELQPHQLHLLMKGAAATAVMQCISCTLSSKGT